MKIFVEELEALGIPVSHYNRPRFDDNPEDLQRCLHSLFAITPPTAIVTMNVELFLAVQQFVSRQKLLVPEDVSLICGDPDPDLGWCRPTIAHISWDSSPWVRRIEKWANNIALGKRDIRQILPDAEFVDGGTIGPAS